MAHSEEFMKMRHNHVWQVVSLDNVQFNQDIEELYKSAYPVGVRCEDCHYTIRTHVYISPLKEIMIWYGGERIVLE
jgi:hypothetical protein